MEDTAFSLLSCWLVARASMGFAGPVGRILASKPAVGLGRISYGLYLYHGVVTTFLWVPLYLVGLQVDDIWPLRPLYYFAATFVVSLLSWKYVERPINRLKDRFPYFDEPDPARRRA